MTNMTGMAVYVKPLKISSPKNTALKQHFIKKHFGFIDYQFCSDDMIRD